MAVTRGSTGVKTPRILEQIGIAPERERKTKAKANTSKPRAKKTESGRVTKTTKTTTTTTTKGAPKKAATKKRAAPKKKQSVVDKVKEKANGVLLKAEGAIENKPGKKAAGTAELRGTKKPTPGTKRTKATK